MVRGGKWNFRFKSAAITTIITAPRLSRFFSLCLLIVQEQFSKKILEDVKTEMNYFLMNLLGNEPKGWVGRQMFLTS